MMKKIKNISKQSLTIALGIVLGTTISIYASSLWHEPGGSNGFLQKVISENRVLKPGEVQKIKEDLEFLKNNESGSGVKRKWVPVIRSERTYYTNTLPYDIEVAVTTEAYSSSENFCRIDFWVDGKLVTQQINNNPNYGKYCSLTVTVPSGSKYYINPDGYKNGKIVRVLELK